MSKFLAGIGTIGFVGVISGGVIVTCASIYVALVCGAVGVAFRAWDFMVAGWLR